MANVCLSRKHEFNSFLKWPGGKRWLAPVLTEIISGELSGRYYEPFLGGGSIFFRLNPKTGYLSDVNPELISCLRTVRDKPEEVIRAVWRYSNTKNCYNRVRSLKARSLISIAARFIYLNRTCWGGIIRFNRKGEFNVPFGNSGRTICSAPTVRNCANALKKAKLGCVDFEDAIIKAREGDVIYADPPYSIQSNNNGFNRFNEKLFTWEDQKRLAKVSNAAKQRGAFVVVTQAWHQDLLNLYDGWWALKMCRLSLVSPEPQNRRTFPELLLVSRKPDCRPAGIKKSFRLI